MSARTQPSSERCEHFVNVDAALIAYTYQEKKPSLNLRDSQEMSDLLTHVAKFLNRTHVQ